MKFAFALIASLITINAFAAKSAELNRFYIDPKAVFLPANPVSASITVSKKEATLTLQPKQIVCRPGELCPAIEFGPLTITLPVVKFEKDSCGSITITAKKDLRTVDGSLEILEVVNNTLNHCRTLVALAPTEVKLTTESLRGEKTYSTFEGEALR